MPSPAPLPTLVELPVGALAMLDAHPQATLLTDEGNVIRYANPAVAELTGWSREDLVGSVLLRLVPERMRARHLEAYARYVAQPQPSRLALQPSLTVPLLRADGTETLVDLRLRGVEPETDAPGQVFVLGTLTPKRVRTDRPAVPLSRRALM